MRNFDEIYLTAIKERSKFNNLNSSASSLNSRIIEKSGELKSVVESIVTQSEAILVVNELLDKIASSRIKEVSELVTVALRTIFFDKKYSCEIYIDESRSSKTAEVILVEETDHGVLRSSVNTAIGGGIQVIIGFVLQVYYLNLYKQSKVMVIDEAFTQVSESYVPYLKIFINKLAEQLGFIFILITHDVRMVYGCHKAYEVIDGTVKEVSEQAARKIVGGDK